MFLAIIKRGQEIYAPGPYTTWTRITLIMLDIYDISVKKTCNLSPKLTEKPPMPSLA
jgi:hypothetical protein